ncbi:hypothetical protein EYF80_031359 [Liparis tanakae]|uniref:Uncharacterized protein n=1 Tax=Liparis tanakae TaxID=230148 RepID=A0A4Z2GXT9_9TELE|nr:hypothetical protein EYF80_031359 [Liparis tanakae]
MSAGRKKKAMQATIARYNLGHAHSTRVNRSVTPKVESCGFLTNVPADVEGVAGTRGCLLVTVLSPSPGAVVVVWAAAHVEAAGTVVSAANLEYIVPAKPSASPPVCSSGSGCAVAGAVPTGGWESETRASLSLCALLLLLCGESDVPVGSGSVPISVTLVRSHGLQAVGSSEASEITSSPEPKCSRERSIGSVSPSAVVVDSADSSVTSEPIKGRRKGGNGMEGNFGRDGVHQYELSGGFSFDDVGPQRASSSATARL